MATTFTAQVAEFARLTKEKLELVVKQSASDVFTEATQTQPGVEATGGSFEVGKVPVSTGYLINSFTIGIDGGSGGGRGDIALVVAGMDLGDSVVGAFTAEYGPIVEYGSATMAGRFFVTSAARQWQRIVALNVQKASKL